VTIAAETQDRHEVGEVGATPSRDLWIARGLTLGPVALAFPLAAWAVFGLGTDRNATADVLAVVYSFGLFLGFTTSLWPLPSLRRWTGQQRVQSLCLIFLIVSCITHLSWELIWLVAHDAIAASRDTAWAYPWWAYMDGGDMRYAEATPTLLTMEMLSVVNGLVCALGLFLWYRSGGRDRRAVLLFMAMAVVHLYSTSLYYGSEILAGLPNVDTSSFLDSWIKFGLANASWLVFPPVVLAWGSGLILERRAGSDPS
jgi:hypothetical protein